MSLLSPGTEKQRQSSPRRWTKNSVWLEKLLEFSQCIIASAALLWTLPMRLGIVLALLLSTTYLLVNNVLLFYCETAPYTFRTSAVISPNNVFYKKNRDSLLPGNTPAVKSTTQVSQRHTTEQASCVFFPSWWPALHIEQTACLWIGFHKILRCRAHSMGVVA